MIIEPVRYLLEVFQKSEHEVFIKLLFSVSYQLKVCGFLSIKHYISDFIVTHKDYGDYKDRYGEVERGWEIVEKLLLKGRFTNEEKCLRDLASRLGNLCEVENSIFKEIVYKN